MKRGTLWTKFALAGLGLSSLSSFISFCKKWYIRDEVCGLTKKKETSRERPKSAPYLRLKKTRKPLFLQLETTKALKKLKIEKKNPNFF